MNAFWYSIARALQATFKFCLVSLGWIPVIIISCTLAFGLLYWLATQAKYTRRAKEKGGYI
jgi:hypothetical protein